MKKRIAIFASGSGTNTQNIIEHFHSGEFAAVVLVLTNKKDAKVLDRAKALEVPAIAFTRDELRAEDGVLQMLAAAQPDLIVLAGFLWKFPEHILQHYPNKVINIHPALLPKYGGKGMYGHHVHQTVVDNKESHTGITIHYVNEHYDEGAIIFQAQVDLTNEDTPETVAAKVHGLEYEHFPRVIKEILSESTRE